MHPVALATGNAFILKVASVSQRLADHHALYKEAGLPLFNVGDRHLVTDILPPHPGIGAISFVGSTPVALVQDTGVAMASVSRPWVARTATRSSCPVRTSSSPRSISAGAFGRSRPALRPCP